MGFSKIDECRSSRKTFTLVSSQVIFIFQPCISIAFEQFNVNSIQAFDWYEYQKIIKSPKLVQRTKQLIARDQTRDHIVAQVHEQQQQDRIMWGSFVWIEKAGGNRPLCMAERWDNFYPFFT